MFLEITLGTLSIFQVQFNPKLMKRQKSERYKNSTSYLKIIRQVEKKKLKGEKHKAYAASSLLDGFRS